MIALYVNFPFILLWTKILLFMLKYHGYRILVGVSPNILLTSSLTSYHSLFTTHWPQLHTMGGPKMGKNCIFIMVRDKNGLKWSYTGSKTRSDFIQVHQVEAPRTKPTNWVVPFAAYVHVHRLGHDNSTCKAC